ncbi:MAG: hypothetical protein ACXWZS_02690 [Gemmatirosa sp.]
MKRTHLLTGAAAVAVLAACSDDARTPSDVLGPRALPSAATTTTRTTAPVVSNVKVGSGRTYPVVARGLVVGGTQYSDRTYTFRTVPAILSGATLIRTANDDKDVAPGSTSLVSFDVTDAAVVYVAMDPGLSRPSWMGAEWTSAGVVLGSTDGNKNYTVYRRTVAAGRVTLGSNVSKAAGKAMYTIGVAGTQVTDTDTGADTVVTSSPTPAPTPAPVPVAPTPAPTPTPTPAPTTPNAPTTGRFVSPTGSAGNDGSLARPWDLRSALAGSTVRAGETVWLRGGTYQGCFTSNLNGTAAAPIVVRQYPGERAILDNGSCNDPALTANGSYTHFWGFEVMNSAPRKEGPLGINAFGDYLKFINLTIHDAGATGIGFWAPAEGGEIYGSVIYNNGRNFNLDHGIYTQNNGAQKVLADNLVFNNWAYGIHAYGSDQALVKNYLVDGNITFGNGSIGENGNAPNLFIGAGSALSGIAVTNNMVYMNGTNSGNLWVGYSWGPTNSDVTLTGNYVAGGSTALRVWKFSRATVSGNTVYGLSELVNIMESFSGFNWSNNTYYGNQSASLWNGSNLSGFKSSGLGSGDAVAGTRPTGAKVFVRANKYEAGRANIAVFNWDRAGSVSVDLSSVLRSGDRYEIRNAVAFTGAPVASGTYGGGAISLPTSVSPTQPIGGSAKPVPQTPEFSAYVVIKTN